MHLKLVQTEQFKKQLKQLVVLQEFKWLMKLQVNLQKHVETLKKIDFDQKPIEILTGRYIALEKKRKKSLMNLD